MNVITRKRLLAFAERQPDAARPLEQWYRTEKRARWGNLQETRRVFPHADLVTVASGNVVTVFNIGGNKYRLIAAMHYRTQRAYVLAVLTHADYDKDDWKKNL